MLEIEKDHVKWQKCSEMTQYGKINVKHIYAEIYVRYLMQRTT